MTIDLYQTVTDRMVAALEAGTVPWRKPWSAGAAPQNIEGHVYRGVNVFLTLMTQWEEGYPTPFWLTFKQAKAHGGTVRKGEHGTTVVFWKRLSVEDPDNPGKRKVIPLLRHYTVFNIAQCDGLTLPKRIVEYNPTPSGLLVPVDAAEAIVTGYPDPPTIREDGTEAWYRAADDLLVVPPRGSFVGMDEFYSTLFHEIGHSTGHPSRLNRKLGNTFGSHEYGREELVAEMTATFLCAETGIVSTFNNSAAYCASWIRTIKEDPRAVVIAAGQAQRAVDHIIGRTFDNESESENGEAA